MKALACFVRYIERFNQRLGKYLGGGVFVLAFIMLYEAVSRYVFNNPTTWSLEIASYCFGVYFLLGGAYVLLRREHVRMDAIYSRWSVRRRAIADAATFSLAVVYLVSLIWKGSIHAVASIRAGERTISAFAALVAPIKVILVVAAVILLLQALAFFIKDISIAVRGKTLE